MRWPEATANAKLDELAEAEGYDDRIDLLTVASLESVVPGICMAPACDYTTEVEPDQDAGHCERCGTKTVVSALVIAGVI